MFEREASSEASSSSRGGASATPRTLLEKPDHSALVESVPRGALCLTRARRAITRAEASRDTAQRTASRVASATVQAPYLDQGQEGASALSGARDP